MLEPHFMFAIITPNAQLQPFRERVHHRYAYPMQTARDLIGIIVKFTASMQLCHDDFCSRNPFFGMNLGGNTAPIIRYRNRAIPIKRNFGDITMPCQSFINGIIYHLIHHMMQTRTIISIANIHARALAHRIQASQNLDGIRTIIFVFYRFI